MTTVTAYAAATDVQMLLETVSGTGLTLSTASKPTLAQAEGFIDQVAAEVNAVLKAAGYSVPVTGPNDLYMLKRYVSQKAAAMTYHAAYGGFGDVPARVQQWEDEYAAFLARIADKTQGLVDVSPARGRMGVVYVSRYTG